MLKQCTSVYNAKDVVNALLLHLLRSVTYARDNMHDYRLIFNYYYYDTLLRRVLSLKSMMSSGSEELFCRFHLRGLQTDTPLALDSSHACAGVSES